MKFSKNISKNLLTNFKNTFKINRTPIISSLILSLFYVTIILYYTHGALIFGGDQYGYYSVSQALVTIDPQSIIYALFLFFSFNNFYSAFYVSLFVFTFVALYSIYHVTIAISENALEYKYLTFIGIIASLFYLFNPLTITNRSLSILSNISIYQTSFIIFLYEVIKLFNNNSYKFKIKDSIIMGIAFAFSLRPFPNYVRIFITAIIIFCCFLIFKILFDSDNLSKNVKLYIRVIFIASIFAIISSLFITLPLIMNFSKINQTATYASTSIVSKASFYYGQFNLLIQTFRLEGLWYFPTSLVPYNKIYFNQPFIILSSLSWVILAIFIPILLINKYSYRIIISLELITVITIFLGKGANLPFGNLFLLAIDHVPFGLQLLPPSFMVQLLLPILYSVLIAYSIAIIGISLIKKTKKNYMFYFTSILLITLVLISALPVFNGTVEGQYFNENIKGYRIPYEYTQVKDYLLYNNANALVLPATGAYVGNSWGYSGAGNIYPAFYYPVKMYTISTFGSYAAANPAYIKAYDNLTEPLKPPLNYSKINSELSDPIYTSKNLTYFRVAYPFKNPVNLNDYSYLKITVNLSNSSTFNSAISGGLQIWVISNGFGNTYTIGPNCHRCYFNISNKTLSLEIFLKEPDTSSQYFNISNVNSLEFEFFNRSKIFNITSTPQIYGGFGFSVNKSWLNLTREYGINYIMVDKSIISGNIETYNYVNQTINYLINESYINPVYSDNTLTLYKINMPN
ncbi:MAG: hypothetical protein KGI27_12690 [Thaumarchaeota archaeon]|nr:hypothetical protein [Nitrososphaerota archaeon]